MAWFDRYLIKSAAGLPPNPEMQRAIAAAMRPKPMAKPMPKPMMPPGAARGLKWGAGLGAAGLGAYGLYQAGKGVYDWANNLGKVTDQKNQAIDSALQGR